MQIKKVKINRYKSITQPLLIDSFSNLHILVGPNNAGKTNVLDAINLFFNSDLEEERFFDKDADVSLTAQMGENEYSWQYKSGSISGNKEVLKKAQKEFVRISNGPSVSDIAPKKLNDFKNNHPKDYQLFSQSLQDNFKGVEINEDLFVLSIHADKANRPIRRMGQGFRRLFIILFYLFHPQYSTIVIDEPEAHLHPSIIRKFLTILTQKDLKNQIFLTTHHPTFVQADYLKHIWRVAREENESTIVYGFPRLDIEIDRFVQEINDDNSGIFFSDKVLLVEGVSDYIFMREIIKKFYRKDKEIKVVYTGGKGSVDVYSQLCDHFKIPYAIMLDYDALDSVPLTRVSKYPEIKEQFNSKQKIDALRKEEIFILRNSLESVFPKKYRGKETKPLTALSISRKITANDLKTKQMSIIREILDTI